MNNPDAADAEAAKLKALDPDAHEEREEYEKTLLLHGARDELPDTPVTERGVSTMLLRATEALNAALHEAENQKLLVIATITKDPDTGSVVHVATRWQSSEN